MQCNVPRIESWCRCLCLMSMSINVCKCFYRDKMSSVKFSCLCEKMYEREMIGHNSTTLGEETPPKSWCCVVVVSYFVADTLPNILHWLSGQGAGCLPSPCYRPLLCSAAPLRLKEGRTPLIEGRQGEGSERGADTQHYSLDIISCLRGQVRSCNITSDLCPRDLLILVQKHWHLSFHLNWNLETKKRGHVTNNQYI